MSAISRCGLNVPKNVVSYNASDLLTFCPERIGHISSCSDVHASRYVNPSGEWLPPLAGVPHVDGLIARIALILGSGGDGVPVAHEPRLRGMRSRIVGGIRLGLRASCPTSLASAAPVPAAARSLAGAQRVKREGAADAADQISGVEPAEEKVDGRQAGGHEREACLEHVPEEQLRD